MQLYFYEYNSEGVKFGNIHQIYLEVNKDSKHSIFFRCKLFVSWFPLCDL
uniref:Uncharacterized protein n=1 Tax=Arion vulgaris TaxID=1028688 RepID=A0A0B6ZQJ2_9EUPU